MTPTNPFERFVEDWLATTACSMDVPGDLHEAVVDRARRTRQRQLGLAFPRSPAKIDFAKVAIGLAAVLVIAVAMVNVLSPLGMDGGLAQPSLSPSTSPTAGSAPTPAPSLGNTAVRPIAGDYLPGRHSMTVDGITFSVVIESAGWEPHDGFQVSKSFVRGQSAEAVLFWTAYPKSLKAFSCFDLGRPTLGSARGVANAVAETRGLITLAGPSEVAIDGRSAYRVIATVRDDEGCDPGYIYNWKVSGGAFWTSTHVGDRITVWAMDVDGGILVIGGLLNAEMATAADLEIEAIVSSMRFE